MKHHISQKEFQKRQLLEFPSQAVLDYHDFGIVDRHDIEVIFQDFLSECLANSYYHVTVVCGTGNLVRQEVKKLLNKHPQVNSFKEGGYYTGGKGAYLVELK